MELPDEAIDYHFQGLIAPTAGGDFSPLAELQSQNFLPLARLRAMLPQIIQVRGQVASEREIVNPVAEMKPLDSGFIDFPQKLLDQHRRLKDQSELGRILALAGRLREQCGGGRA